MITISLCMIVKNEESTLKRCLDSIADLMDEIIIIDTGSTDNTKKIASQYTSKIYDYEWINDFADARNYSFSKATMDYIYVPDADEVLDNINHERFLNLKKHLLPEIEMVQMKYITVSNNTVLNSKKEYRPKLFKRLRSFTWIDPIHETVRLNPVVYDSDIEILHMPIGSHGKRDFGIFLDAYNKNGILSSRISKMYAKELLKVGSIEDLDAAKPFFISQWNKDPSSESGKEAACVLSRHARLIQNGNELFKYALRDMLETPCSEICYDLGEYYYAAKDYDEAIIWFYNACYETQCILDIHTCGDLPLKGLINCYSQLIQINTDLDFVSSCQDALTNYQSQLDNYDIPEEL